jgi:FkbM family methyltransferase
MSSSIKSKQLFVNKHGRMTFFYKCLLWPLNQQLHKRSRRHISEKRKQLVVFSFDHIAHTINLNGIYEKDDLDTFFKWMHSIDVDFSDATALDIGANIGNHSLYFSDHFKKVISFEPNPRTYKVLSLNAELVGNVVCHNVGLSDRTGDAVLSINPDNIGGSSITDGKSLHSQDIKLIELDSFEKFDNVKLLKIDVEGHEYKALWGAKHLIKEHMPIVLFEQHLSDFDEGRSPVVLLLQQLGYKDFAVVKKHPRFYGSKFRKFFLAPISRTIFGESTRIENLTEIKPDFYSFIIALPGWLTAKDRFNKFLSSR